jgi:hypothetical protein
MYQKVANIPAVVFQVPFLPNGKIGRMNFCQLVANFRCRCLDLFHVPSFTGSQYIPSKWFLMFNAKSPLSPETLSYI